MSDRLDPSFFYIRPTCKTFDIFWENCKMNHEPYHMYESSRELDVEKCLDAIRIARKELLRICDYTEKDIARANYVNTVLYLKPVFILRNSKPKWELMRVYLADQGVLFAYSDEQYCTRCISREIVSARCLLSRNSNERRHLYEHLPTWKETTFAGKLLIPEEEREVHIALLNKIYGIAAEKHLSLDRWVETHICRATPSEDERMAIVDKTGLTEVGEQRLRSIIKIIISDVFCRTFLPNSEAYDKAEQNLSLFQELLPEYRSRIDTNFCRSFVNFVLPDYMDKIQLAVAPQYQPKHITATTKMRLVVLYALYSYRASLLDHLHGLFCEKHKSNLELPKIHLFTLHNDICTASECENAIVTAIQNYFVSIGKPLSDDPCNYLLSRVQWAFTVTLPDDALRPAFFFYIVICCKRNLVSGRDIEIPKQTKGPWFIDGSKDRSTQRTAQLMLLDKFFEIFQLNQEDRIKNQNQFLLWQGKEIQSIEEIAYWQKQLDGDYNLLPIIGFQLCCRDYLKSCLTPHFEDLSYTVGSPLHCGGYLTFWKNNQEAVQKQAILLGKKHPKLVKDYEKLWNNPGNSFCNSKPWLEKQLASDCKIDLEEFQYSDAYDETELAKLILESEFRLCICHKAREKLIKLCINICGLNPGLFADFE